MFYNFLTVKYSNSTDVKKECSTLLLKKSCSLQCKLLDFALKHLKRNFPSFLTVCFSSFLLEIGNSMLYVVL